MSGSVLASASGLYGVCPIMSGSPMPVNRGGGTIQTAQVEFLPASIPCIGGECAMFDRSGGVCSFVTMARSLSGLVAALPSLGDKADRVADNLGDLESSVARVGQAIERK